ncbi:PilN domain-containing protein [Luedemannella flava]
MDARRTRQSRRLVVITIVPFLVALGAWYVFAVHETAATRAYLGQIESEIEKTRQRAEVYRDVEKTQGESAAIGKKLQELFADDVAWDRLTGSVREAAPTKVRITGASGTKLAGIADKLRQGGARPSVVGTFTVTGTAPDKRTVARYVDTIGVLPGLANPLLTDAVREDDKVRFAVRLDVTDAALGGRFEATKAKP